MWILGISAFYHDSAAALVRDGEVMAAAQEERFTRKKHDARFPAHAVRYCATAQHAKEAPMTWPNCCRAGVAPTRYPTGWAAPMFVPGAIAAMCPAIVINTPADPAPAPLGAT